MDANKKIKSAFPDILSDLINNSGKTLREIARESGVGPSQLSAYQSGTNEPNMSSLVKLSAYFDVSVDWLIGRPNGAMSTKEQIQNVRKVTGLSEKAINALNGADDGERDFISFLIEKRISSDISSMAYGCAFDKSSILKLDTYCGTLGKDKDTVRKMIRESADVRKVFDEVKQLQERVDTRLWRCHKILENAVESFVNYILKREENNGKR